MATINAALHAFAVRKRAAEVIAAFDVVQVDLDDGGRSWGYGGGRDLSALAADAGGAETA